MRAQSRNWLHGNYRTCRQRRRELYRERRAVRVFVTGGSSPLGDVVIPHLVQAGVVCTCLVRSGRAADRVLRSGGIPLEGDLSNGGWWAESKKHDSLVHMAGIILGDIIIPALEKDQPTVVVSSASATNQHHPLRTEIIAHENHLLDIGQNLSILRPTMIYGSPRDRNMRKLAAAINRFPTHVEWEWIS